jgi:uncharacterized protein
MQDVGGVPVSMASITRKTSDSVSLSGVYTPPDRRGRGLATACVGGLCRLLLQQGNPAVQLFADKQNAVSNAIYSKLGFRMIADFQGFVPRDIATA